MASKNADDIETSWTAVTGKSLALMALRFAQLADNGIATRGKFLMGLGLSRKDAAAMLGTSPHSLTVLISQANKKKKGGSGLGRKKAGTKRK